MAKGDIGSIQETYRFEISGSTRAMDVLLLIENIYIIAYVDLNSDLRLITLRIDSGGNIGTPIGTKKCEETATQGRIIRVGTNIFALVYASSGNVGRVITWQVNDDGSIEAAGIGTLDFEGTFCDDPSIAHSGQGDYYVITYRGSGNIGKAVTVEIDSAGNIGAAIINSLTFDATLCYDTSTINVGPGMVAVAYQGPSNHGTLKTMDIDASGNLGSVQDSLEFDTTLGAHTYLLHIDGTTYAIAYNGGVGTGGLQVCTVDIQADGDIGAAVIAVSSLDTAGIRPCIARVDVGMYLVAYRGPDDDGWVLSVPIDGDGTIGAVVDSLEFDTTYGDFCQVFYCSGLIFAVAYLNNLTSDWLKTIDIERAGGMTGLPQAFSLVL